MKKQGLELDNQDIKTKAAKVWYAIGVLILTFIILMIMFNFKNKDKRWLKMLIKSRTKFDIPANFIFSKEQKAVLIVVHGFASSKESPTCKRLEEIMPKIGISTIAIDLPNHGEIKMMI